MAFVWVESTMETIQENLLATIIALRSSVSRFNSLQRGLNLDSIQQRIVICVILTKVKKYTCQENQRH